MVCPTVALLVLAALLAMAFVMKNRGAETFLPALSGKPGDYQLAHGIGSYDLARSGLFDRSATSSPWLSPAAAAVVGYDADTLE